MNHKFNKLTKKSAQPAIRQAVVAKLGVGLPALALAGLLALSATAANPPAAISTVLDPGGDAVFPFDLYHAPVPPYLDIIRVSVSSSRGILHFEIQMNADIPVHADPGFTPTVNHLGPTFALLTDPATAQYPNHYFGHVGNYRFNYFLGGLYSVADSGVGLGLGWHGFLIDLSTFTPSELPLQIRKDTLILEINAASIGNPATISYVVASECDPFPIPQEKTKSALLVDFAPDHGYGTWPPQ